MKHKFTRDEIEEIVKDCKTIADFCRKVGWQPRGDNYKIFHKYVKDYNLDISHFTGQATNIRNCLNKHNEKKSDYYLNDNIMVSGNKLLKKLVEEGKKEYKCECCGNSTWMDKFIRLELHHIDGDHFNNNIENLQLLCPNCHSQTKNYKGRNINKSSIKVCKYCGKQLFNDNKNGCCKDCYNEYVRPNKRPKKEELEKYVNNLSYSKMAKIFNISDKTIKKWLCYYNLI